LFSSHVETNVTSPARLRCPNECDAQKRMATAVQDLRVKFAFEFLARQEEVQTLISTTAEITMMPSDSAPETMRNARICPG
jgi:hypothetical protein